MPGCESNDHDASKRKEYRDCPGVLRDARRRTSTVSSHRTNTLSLAFSFLLITPSFLQLRDFPSLLVGNLELTLLSHHQQLPRCQRVRYCRSPPPSRPRRLFTHCRGIQIRGSALRADIAHAFRWRGTHEMAIAFTGQSAVWITQDDLHPCYE
jgi:hypothetical protein